MDGTGAGSVVGDTSGGRGSGTSETNAAKAYRGTDLLALAGHGVAHACISLLRILLRVELGPGLVHCLLHLIRADGRVECCALGIVLALIGIILRHWGITGCWIELMVWGGTHIRLAAI